MLTVVQQTKVCRNPNCAFKGMPQPIESFYKCSGSNRPLSQCKSCYLERSKEYNKHRLPKDQPQHHTEIIAIARLHEQGIPSLPGKAYSDKRVDILAWGCIRIEVKTGTLLKNKRYHYPRFNFHLATKGDRRLFAVLVMLICDYDTEKTFHIIPANHPVFFINGVLKTGVSYEPGNLNAGHKAGKTRVVMTDDIMKEYQDRWDLIEQARLNFAEQLRLGAAN